MLFYYIKDRTKRSVCAVLSAALFVCGLSMSGTTAHAASLDELAAEAEARKSLPIQTNEIDNWPAGPAISAESPSTM